MKEEYINVALCSGNGCTVAALCHRATGYKTITSEDKTLRVVNPMIVTSNDQCPMFSRKQSVRYAKGFLNMEQNLPRSVFETIKKSLLDHFGKNPYYEMRKGTRLISPKDQQYFAAQFLMQGITDPYPFDEYVDVEEWT